MQFNETNSKQGTCPVCGKPVPVRSVRDVRKAVPSYCSRVCASMRTFNSRYKGSMSGPMNRPSLLEKTKFEG